MKIVSDFAKTERNSGCWDNHVFGIWHKYKGLDITIYVICDVRVFCEGQDPRSCEVHGSKKALTGIRAADNKTFLVDVPGAFELHFTLI